MDAGTGQGLHSRDGQKLLKAQFNKFPELEQIHKNIASYSDEDIDSLSYRPWIKKQLKQAKKVVNNAAALKIAEEIARIMREKTGK